MSSARDPFHPKWHRERMPIFWWLRRASHARFIVRELTSVFVAYTVVLVLIAIRALGAGEAEWSRMQSWLSSPLALGLHVVVLGMLLVHSVTWLNLAPQAMALRFRGRRVPDLLVVAAHYGAWVAASAIVVAALLGR